MKGKEKGTDQKIVKLLKNFKLFKEISETLVHIYDFGIERGRKEGVGNNIILDDGTKYYLSESDFHQLYALLSEENYNLPYFNSEYNLWNKPYLLSLPKLKKSIIGIMQNFCSDDKTVLYKGTKGPVSTPVRFEKIIAKKFVKEPAVLGICIYKTIQDNVLNATLKNELNKDNKYEITEPKMWFLLGNAVMYLILYRYKELELFFRNFEKEVKIEETQIVANLWCDLFELIIETVDGTKKNPLKECFKDKITVNKVKNIFNTLEINVFNSAGGDAIENVELELIVLRILLAGLEKVKRLDILNDKMVEILDNYLIDMDKVKELRIIFKSRYDEIASEAGICLVNYLVQNTIFERILSRKKKLVNHEYLENSYTYTSKNYKLELNSDIQFQMCTSTSNFLPYLIKGNELQVNTIVDDDDLRITYTSNKFVQVIHNKWPCEATLQEDSEFKKDSDILLTKYSIDRSFFLQYLEFLNMILNKKLEDFCENRALVFDFLSLYNINFERLLDQCTDKNLKLLIMDLINYALNFEENITDQRFIKQINEIQDMKKRKQFNAILNTINGYKFAFIGTISQVALYSAFESFFIPSFFDFRGRKYHVGTHLNPQSYPFIRAFVKLYENMNQVIKKEENKGNENLSTVMYNSIYRVIQHNEVKLELEKLKKDLISGELLLERILSYFCSFINENSKKDFIKMFENSCNEKNTDFILWFSFINKRIKDKRKSLMLTSYVILEIRIRIDDPNIVFANAYGYDAGASGYQMLAILFNSYNLGILTNLEGLEKKDIYKSVCEKYIEYVQLANRLLTVTLTRITQLDRTQLYNDIILNKNKNKVIDVNSASLSELIIFFFTQPSLVDTTINHILRKIDYLLNENENSDLNKFFKAAYNGYHKELNWLLSKYTIFQPFLQLKNSSMTFLFYMYEIIRLSAILEQHTWIKTELEDRSIFKKLVMIQIYGGTSISRKASVRDYLYEKALTLGLPSLDFKTIAFISSNVDKFFRYYVTKYMPESSLLFILGKIIIEDLKPTNKAIMKNYKFNTLSKSITIINQDFKISLVALKYQTNATRIVVRTNVDNRNYKISLQRPYFAGAKSLLNSQLLYDQDKMQRLFPPNFIHSMDAYIPCFLVKTLSILRDFYKSYNITCYALTNHDNFSIGRAHFAYLPILLRDAYIALHRYNYIYTIMDNFDNLPDDKKKDKIDKILNLGKAGNTKFLSGTFENPNFIKFG